MRMVLKEELLTDEVKVRRMIEVQGRKSSRKRKEVKEEVKEEEGYIRGRKKKMEVLRSVFRSFPLTLNMKFIKSFL